MCRYDFRRNGVSLHVIASLVKDENNWGDLSQPDRDDLFVISDGKNIGYPLVTTDTQW